MCLPLFGLAFVCVSCLADEPSGFARLPQPKGTDPNEGPVCPSGQPHLLIAVNTTDYSRGNAIVRRDVNLNPCRGVTIPRDNGDITAVGGTSDGRDLVGTENGYVLLIEDDALLWSIDGPDRYPAGSVFTIQYQGTETVAVLWMDYHLSSGEILELYTLADRTHLRSFDVSFSVHDAAPPVDGSSDRVATEYDNDGIQHYRIDPHGDTLADGDERQIPRTTEHVGAFQELTVYPGMSLITGGRGVLYWPNNASPAFLGPVACAWPARVGEALPLVDTGNFYTSATVDPAHALTFLAVYEGRIEGAERDDTYIYRMTHRGECVLLEQASEDDSIDAIAWSGV